MRRETAKKILETGGAKRKIKLLLEEIAQTNTLGSAAEDLLTEKEREQILAYTAEPQYRAYYANMSSANTTFLLYRGKSVIFKLYLEKVLATINGVSMSFQNHHFYEDVINEIIFSIEDKETAAKALEIALKKTKRFGSNADKNLLGLTLENKIKQGRELAEHFERYTEATKSHFNLLERFTKEILPLQPYRAYVKKNLKNVKEVYESGASLLQVMQIEIKAYDDLPGEAAPEQYLQMIEDFHNG
jgi:hypothetical protein